MKVGDRVTLLAFRDCVGTIGERFEGTPKGSVWVEWDESGERTMALADALAIVCVRCDEDGGVSLATEDAHGEPLCAGCYDQAGARQDEGDAS